MKLLDFLDALVGACAGRDAYKRVKRLESAKLFKAIRERAGAEVMVVNSMQWIEPVGSDGGAILWHPSHNPVKWPCVEATYCPRPCGLLTKAPYMWPIGKPVLVVGLKYHSRKMRSLDAVFPNKTIATYETAKIQKQHNFHTDIRQVHEEYIDKYHQSNSFGNARAQVPYWSQDGIALRRPSYPLPSVTRTLDVSPHTATPVTGISEKAAKQIPTLLNYTENRVSYGSVKSHTSPPELKSILTKPSKLALQRSFRAQLYGQEDIMASASKIGMPVKKVRKVVFDIPPNTAPVRSKAMISRAQTKCPHKSKPIRIARESSRIVPKDVSNEGMCSRIK
jgi:hypothetical protein